MKSASQIAIVAAILTMLFAQNTKAASPGTAFDGTWAVTVDFHEYKNPDGTMALAAVKHFPAKVKNGILHGESGTRGTADWYELNGTIEADGTATIRASGITGNPKQTPFHKHGTPFEYQVNARFNGRHGTGQSVGDPAPPHSPRVRIYTFVKD
jgi:hypothetical protein